MFGLDHSKIILAFGATGGLDDSRKGGDLFLQAMRYMLSKSSDRVKQNLHFLLFGGAEYPHSLVNDPSVTLISEVSDAYSMRAIYSAVDLFILPSRQDNLPLTGIEAHACGTPVVGFSIGGLVDIVDHCETGALAEPFSAESLAAQILWCIHDQERLSRLSVNARLRAEKIWSSRSIAQLYSSLYSSLV